MATHPGSRWRSKLHEVIFEADTPAGKAFDVGLLIAAAPRSDRPRYPSTIVISGTR